MTGRGAARSQGAVARVKIGGRRRGAGAAGRLRRVVGARSRTGLGVVGLIGVLLTGLGWIGNLRSAIDGVWGREPAKVNFLLSNVASRAR